MHDPSDWSRREFVTTSLLGTGAIAGCTARGEPTDPTPAESSDCLDDWLAGANAYEGVIDRYGPDDTPEVTVGDAPGGGHGYDAFGPAAVRVPPGTTVEWAWSGRSGPANVVALDGSFDSGEPVATHGETFEHTFEKRGTHRYVSEPQRDDGMRGAVVVADPPESDYPAVDSWLADVNVYDGTVVDRVGAPSPTLTVASAAGERPFSFSPPAVRVGVGATVRWVWRGNGPHNVVFEDIDVGSEIRTDPGVGFEYAFEEPGVYRYACDPHHALGAKGALVVEEVEE